MKPLSDNSLRTAALVLHGLSQQQAEQIRSRLEPGERRRLQSALKRLAEVTSGEILDALERLAREAERNIAAEATRDPLREIAKPLVGGNEDQLPAEDSSEANSASRSGHLVAASSPFAFLRHLDPHLLASLIVDEHPEDIAIVLTELPSPLAAESLQQFDAILRFSVLRRMCRLEKVNTHRIEELAFQLKQRLTHRLSGRGASTEPPLTGKGLSAAARAVSLVEPKSRRELLAQLRVVDGDLAEEVSSQVFEFEQLGRLSDEQIKLLLKTANTAWWAPALAAAKPEVRDRILSCLAAKAAAIVKREIKALGEAPPQITERAQQEIVSLWLRLSDQSL
jgi:flagellar motor switch protein FliG